MAIRESQKSRLDDIIRDSLRADTRRVPQSNIALMRLMQRAQTEVAQLPAEVPTIVGTDNIAAFVEPTHGPLLLARTEPKQIIYTPNLYDQIRAYRDIMDMKMWRTLGPCSMLVTI